MGLTAAMSIILYEALLAYTLCFDSPVYRSNGLVFQLWIDWPYFAAFGSLLIILCCAVSFGSKMSHHMTSLMLLQMTVCGLYQFEANALDWYGRPNHLIHYLNHWVLGSPFSIQCDGYPITQHHLYTFNVIMIWLQIPLCTVISISYPVRSLSIVTVATMVTVSNPLTYCISAVFHGMLYAPGMWTAAFIILPFAGWMVSVMIRDGVIEEVDVGWIVIIGIVLHLPPILVMSLRITNAMEMVMIYVLSLVLINAMVFCGLSSRQKDKMN